MMIVAKMIAPRNVIIADVPFCRSSPGNQARLRGQAAIPPSIGTATGGPSRRAE
jgi:hypothetical protein